MHQPHHRQASGPVEVEHTLRLVDLVREGFDLAIRIAIGRLPPSTLITMRTEEEFVREHLLAPLEITDYQWEAVSDGATLGGAGLHLRPRDLARFGKLMLDCVRGDSHLVPSVWCRQAGEQRIPPEVARAPDAPIRDVRRGYGYYFWTLPDQAAFAAWGHGGQFLLVVPARNLVLVQVALPDSDYLHGGWLEDFVELTAPLHR